MFLKKLGKTNVCLPYTFLTNASFALQKTKKKEIIDRGNNHQKLDLSILQNGTGRIQCLVIVNNVLNLQWLAKAVKCCDNIVLADGGANRFFETPFKDSQKVRAIVGDFDSLKPNVRKFYQMRGVQIQQVWNQDTNDFQKAVNKAISKGWTKIFCFGAFGGRMDHTLSSMHHAQKLSKKNYRLSICLFGQTNLMYLMRPKIKHSITIPDSLYRNYCGLIPFGKAENVVSKGLKWNLGPQYPYQTLQWGEFISTSNQFDGDTIQVETTDNLFFVSHYKNYTQ